MPSDLLAEPGAEPRSAWKVHPIRRSLFVLMLLLFALFWIWALFFASKTAVNKVEDRAWAARAEQICAAVDPELRALETQVSNDLVVRAGLVRKSTDLLSQMLDDVVAVAPTDEKGQAIVPEWEADYRILLADRYRYADMLRVGQGRTVHRDRRRASTRDGTHRDVRRRQRDAELRPTPRLGPLTGRHTALR